MKKKYEITINRIGDGAQIKKVYHYFASEKARKDFLNLLDTSIFEDGFYVSDVKEVDYYYLPAGSVYVMDTKGDNMHLLFIADTTYNAFNYCNKSNNVWFNARGTAYDLCYCAKDHKLSTSELEENPWLKDEIVSGGILAGAMNI